MKSSLRYSGNRKNACYMQDITIFEFQLLTFQGRFSDLFTICCIFLQSAISVYKYQQSIKKHQNGSENENIYYMPKSKFSTIKHKQK